MPLEPPATRGRAQGRVGARWSGGLRPRDLDAARDRALSSPGRLGGAGEGEGARSCSRGEVGRSSGVIARGDDGTVPANGGRGGRAPAPTPVRVVVVVLAVVGGVSIGALVAVVHRPGWFAALGNAAPSEAPTPHRAVRPTAPSSSTVPVTSPLGDVPVLSAIAPTLGVAGATVTVVGTGFFSADHHVVVTFDGQVVPTSCPSEQRCVATVPPANSGASVAAVQVVTAVGTSNPLTFEYSGGAARPTAPPRGP
jgi:hypothetical protein